MWRLAGEGGGPGVGGLAGTSETAVAEVVSAGVPGLRARRAAVEGVRARPVAGASVAAASVAPASVAAASAQESTVVGSSVAGSSVPARGAGEAARRVGAWRRPTPN